MFPYKFRDFCFAFQILCRIVWELFILPFHKHMGLSNEAFIQLMDLFIFNIILALFSSAGLSFYWVLFSYLVLTFSFISLFWSLEYVYAFFELLEHNMISLLNSFSGPFSRKFSLPVTITGLVICVGLGFSCCFCLWNIYSDYKHIEKDRKLKTKQIIANCILNHEIGNY